MTHPVTFIFAGGGSGGHISPGLAIAERLASLDPGARALFLCSGREVDRLMLTAAGARFQAVPASPPSVRPHDLARFVRNFVATRRAARAVMSRERVGRVVALGGFVAAPIVAEAVRRRVPATLVNLDAPPGKANRWMARRCRPVLSAIEVPQRPGFADRVVGMPVRAAAIAPGGPAHCRAVLGLDPDRPTLLVTGASQGASTLNELVPALAAARPASFDGWHVLHLCGPGACESVRAAYRAAGVRAVVEPFVSRMGLAWGSADCALSRAGASSVAEAWANAVPTIFLPYPHHRDRHQVHNARPMEAVGGALVSTDLLTTSRNLRGAGRELCGLLGEPARRQAMRDGLRLHPPPDGAETIARMLLEEAVLQ